MAKSKNVSSAGCTSGSHRKVKDSQLIIDHVKSREVSLLNPRADCSQQDKWIVKSFPSKMIYDFWRDLNMPSRHCLVTPSFSVSSGLDGNGVTKLCAKGQFQENDTT